MRTAKQVAEEICQKPRGRFGYNASEQALDEWRSDVYALEDLLKRWEDEIRANETERERDSAREEE